MRYLPSLFAVLSLVSLAGCLGSRDRSSLDEQRGSQVDKQQAANLLPAGAFRNEKGALVCPVMGDEIASVAEAKGHEEYQGKSYYFCCNSCVAAFKKEPEKYADGRFLKDSAGGCEGSTSAASAPAGFCK